MPKEPVQAPRYGKLLESAEDRGSMKKLEVILDSTECCYLKLNPHIISQDKTIDYVVIEGPAEIFINAKKISKPKV